MKIFYCYSIPLKKFLKNENIFPISEDFKVNPNSNKHYWEFTKGVELDKALALWKQNKIKAIEYIKNN